MENYPYSSYPESGNSSPRSREVDGENQSWEEPTNYRVKFLCSYGGKIHPRPHDNQLAYVGGHTKILAIDRNMKFSGMLSNISALSDGTDVCFKYQLPGEDLDALISVTDDEDLEHLMVEYDRLLRTTAKPARLRLFLFPLNPNPLDNSGIPPAESKQNQQWFVDALNSAPVQTVANPAVSSTVSPDFLFGFDKGASVPELTREFPVNEPSPASSPSAVENRDGFPVESKVLKEEQQIREQVTPDVTPPEIQRQIHEFQNMQIAAATQDQQAAIYQRQQDESQARAFPDMTNGGSIPADYYWHRVQNPNRFEQVSSPNAPPVTAAYWPERQVPETDQQVYMIQTGTGVYPANFRSVAGQWGAGQGFYATPRTVSPSNYYPETYRDPSTFYGAPSVGAYPKSDVGPDSAFHPAATQNMSDMVGTGWNVSDTRYHAVATPPREMYYSVAAPPVPGYQNMTATTTGVEARQVRPANQEPTLVNKPSYQP